MVFTTHIFVFYFLPAVLIVYFALPPCLRLVNGNAATISRACNLWLLLMSYVFYGWWNPWFILLMLFVTVVNYHCGNLMSRPGATPMQRRFWLIAGRHGRAWARWCSSSTSCSSKPM